MLRLISEADLEESGQWLENVDRTHLVTKKNTHLKYKKVKDAPGFGGPADFSSALAVDARLGHDGEGLVGELVQHEVDDDGAEDDDEREDVQLEEERISHFLVR